MSGCDEIREAGKVTEQQYCGEQRGILRQKSSQDRSDSVAFEYVVLMLYCASVGR